MRIHWTQPATQDLTNICAYIEERDTSSAARRLALLIYRSVTSLDRFPNRGRIGRKENTRELVITNLPYVVIYRVSEKAV